MELARPVGYRIEEGRTGLTLTLGPLLDEGHALERVRLERSADLRYAGQNYELEVDGADGAPEVLRATFERRRMQGHGATSITRLPRRSARPRWPG